MKQFVEYRESDKDLVLQFALWHPQTSVHVISEANYGESVVVDSILTQLQEFVCLETDWFLATSIENSLHDECQLIRNSPSHNRKLLRSITTQSYRQLQETDSFLWSGMQDDISGRVEEQVIVLGAPQLMIKDVSQDSLEWTSWTLQYSVLDRYLADQPFLHITDDEYQTTQETVQDQLDHYITSGKFTATLQESLSGARASVIGDEYESFTTTEEIVGEDGTVILLPGAASVPTGKAMNYEPESNGLMIFGFILLFCTLCCVVGVFRLAKHRREEVRRRWLAIREQRGLPIDAINCMFDDSRLSGSGQLGIPSDEDEGDETMLFKVSDASKDPAPNGEGDPPLRELFTAQCD